VLICVAVALFFGAIAAADARTRRQRRPTGFQVALQPFSVVRDAIHDVADPLVHNAPRAVAAVATAPIRVAYRATRDEEPRYQQQGDHDGNREDEDQGGQAYGSARVYRGEPVRSAQRVDEGVPMRVAYVTTTRRAERAPQSEVLSHHDDVADDREATNDSAEPEKRSRAEMPPFENSGSKPMVAGSRAVLRNGVAYAPSHAPQSVKNAIWAANTLRRKPYVWGGGHGSFYDRGYDCSGTVSFVLHGAGALAAPLPSRDFMRYGERGRGRWITIYSRRGHTFAMIAGLRLDTTDFQNGGNTGPRWHADARDTRGYVARHPAGM
jgi:cell wall-associated NlpC family hydrolase